MWPCILSFSIDKTPDMKAPNSHLWVAMNTQNSMFLSIQNIGKYIKGYFDMLGGSHCHILPMVSSHKFSPWYCIYLKPKWNHKNQQTTLSGTIQSLNKSTVTQKQMPSKSKITRKLPGGGDIWQVWDAKIWTFWGQTKIFLYFFINHKMTESNSLGLSQEILVDRKEERQMEKTNLEKKVHLVYQDLALLLL